ncbi:MAG: DUF2946 family protein [Rhodoferax sp.]|uniref:DUF2946 family protein n=1 Tax=Rhodoferax sp. TaxID=50421 RepID=UPI00301721DD
MDEIVKQALAKWPNVPDCYGWLGLDARGNWYMRDERAQASGPFAGGCAQSKGSLLKHEKLIEFIQRNYEPDAQGQWFFQNGPQRVYVELEITPQVWRVNDDFSVQDHTGKAAVVAHCLVDENGFLYLQADTRFGLVHTMDMGPSAEAIEQGVWTAQEVISADLPKLYNFVLSPLLLQNK